MSRTFFALSLGLLFASSVWSQVQTGRITGTIFDPNRAAVPNAAITVTNRGTGVARRVTTDGTGAYVVPSLDPGIYNVSATAAGFKTTVRNDVEMLVGRDLLLDLDRSGG
jgi:protocatechuate 3,4-dioxygenase beta subunit